MEKSIEIEELVRTAIEAVRRALPSEAGFINGIKFELAVLTSKEAGGGLKIFVADASGKYTKESVSRISFEIGSINKHDAWIPNPASSPK